MRILNGWKEIAEYLHRTTRSARRWERLGLPVRRISNSPRSPIVAFADELEGWVRNRQVRSGSIEANCTAYRQTRFETHRLVDELRAAHLEHTRLLRAIREQINVSESNFVSK
jgi:hypothetical protein